MEENYEKGIEQQLHEEFRRLKKAIEYIEKAQQIATEVTQKNADLEKFKINISEEIEDLKKNSENLSYGFKFTTNKLSESINALKNELILSAKQEVHNLEIQQNKQILIYVGELKTKIINLNSELFSIKKAVETNHTDLLWQTKIEKRIKKNSTTINVLFIVFFFFSLLFGIVSLANGNIAIGSKFSNEKILPEEKQSPISGLYEGSVDKYPIIVHLENDGIKITGKYFYKYVNEDIQLEGTCENTKLKFNEFLNSKLIGTFDGNFSNNSISGNFFKPNKDSQLSFAISKIDGTYEDQKTIYQNFDTISIYENQEFNKFYIRNAKGAIRGILTYYSIQGGPCDNDTSKPFTDCTRVVYELANLLGYPCQCSDPQLNEMKSWFKNDAEALEYCHPCWSFPAGASHGRGFTKIQLRSSGTLIYVDYKKYGYDTQFDVLVNDSITDLFNVTGHDLTLVKHKVHSSKESKFWE
jgi:hypothetical protein